MPPKKHKHRVRTKGMIQRKRHVRQFIAGHLRAGAAKKWGSKWHKAVVKSNKKRRLLLKKTHRYNKGKLDKKKGIHAMKIISKY